MTTANEIHSCEVCGNDKLEPVLDLGRHPLCDDLVPVGDGRVCAEYPIEILYCAKCATAHQRFQVPKRELFPATYHYRSRFTADVLNGMSALVDACEQRLGGLQGKLVLDVGCNDGSLLDFFRKKGAKTVGIEPTGAYRDGLDKGHDLLNGFFSPQTAREIRAKHGSPDVITFTNVFAHIENLPEVIEALKALMSPRTMLVVENHYLGAVLDRHQFDTFYHEHPRTYSLTSFQLIAGSLGVGLNGVEFPARYGGNIRVFMGGPRVAPSGDAPSVESVLAKEAAFGERLRRMQGEVARWKSTMAARIRDLVATHGKLSGKAFPGRAAILVKLLGIDSDAIVAVYEKPGSMKIGHYLPGTRIPIESDDDFFALASKPPVMLNLAWHISGEIGGYLRKQGYAGEIVDILDPREFFGLTRPMYTIVGSGFGLYGYLPALVEGLGETVVLPRAYEAKVRARPELADALCGIRWVDDAEAALAQATGVVVATPPQRQLEVASRCLALPHLERLVLEKPVAPTPGLAEDLLARLDAAGKRYRIGYTLLHAGWHDALDWPGPADAGAVASIAWTFMAHHFANRASTWKRVHAEGGGVLRFFGVHLVALMAHRGYDGVRSSSLEGEDPREPERWQAVFTGAGLPECRVRVDSRAEAKRFEVARAGPAGELALLSLQDPFEQERPKGSEDRRVGVLERLLGTFNEEDRAFRDLYARVNLLWRKVEEA